MAAKADRHWLLGDERELFTQWQDLFAVLLPSHLLVRSHLCVSSDVVSCENQRCVSDCSRQHR